MNTEAGSILVVDDNEMNRDMLSRRLERKGYRITVAEDGSRALELIGRQRFDLILLDVMMPGLNGFEVLKFLRESHPATELPVIMATAKDQSQDVVEALKLGANDYVTKPLDFPVVLARIQTQLSLKLAVDEIRRLKQNLAQRNEELEAANVLLKASRDRMKHDLDAAARIQQALLPAAPLETSHVDIAWAFKPCDELAGDILNIIKISSKNLCFYVLDVSGHGVKAALLAVTISRVLSPQPVPSALLKPSLDDSSGPCLVPPVEVAAHLNRRFPMDLATEQFFTLLYGVLDLETGRLDYVSAGHPEPIHLPRYGGAALLGSAGLPIGIVEEPDYEGHDVTLQTGDRLYLYSDGIPEATNSRGEQFGKARLLGLLDQSRTLPLKESVSALLRGVEEWCGDACLNDDVSILAIEVMDRVLG